MAILITGASAGFGEAMCRSFVAAGYHVVGAARRIEKLQALHAEFGERFLPLEMDMTRPDSIDSALQNLPEPFASVDCLINNAGLALGLDAAHKADFSDWQTMIQTNIVGLSYLTRKVLPFMVERKNGYIINIGSIAGTYPYPGGNVYGATKAYVRQFSLNLRADLAGTGVRVSNIEPGLCGDTEFSNIRFKGDNERAAQLYENVQFIRPQDIADTALWLYQRPAHMNVNSIEIMPVAQSFGALPVHREAPPIAAAVENGFDKQSMSLFQKIKSWFK
ncbi:MULTISPECIES: SDR family oxidoreductase [Neisseria]|uniref:NADP-dependent 3-hydroxy acid dehydrogenase n=1 Tax=Neisseria dumasiana TaxID=1931275 RepID=A0ABX3WML8_9NEIS|nr:MULTISPECIES: SDR family oxidoreductase [Neisseria]KPN74009.1 malonic semialdehyde reductase [Neisseria sp. 74A18]OSI35946.1 NADP-dependent 3-hydroxy acid dehydrogenase [Neisseria dumasiana]UOO84663.1 SDR family oxidoreductase [Neisseria dumasiana]